MVDRSSRGRRRDPDRPIKRGRPRAVTPRRPVAQLAALAVIGLSLYAVSGSTRGAAARVGGDGGHLITESLTRVASGPAEHLTDGIALLITGAVALTVSLVSFGWCLVVRSPGVDATRFGLCLATFCWGLSNVLNGLQHMSGGEHGPSLIGLLGFVMLPIALVAVQLGARGSASAWPRLRLALDSLAVGGAAGFAFWQLARASGTGLWTTHGPVVCVLVIADMTLLAMVTLSAVRDVSGRLWPAAAGLLAYVVGDVLVVVNASPYGDPLKAEQLPTMVLWCVAWLLIGIGTVRYRGPRGAAPRSRDLREAASAQLAAAVVTGLVLVGMMIGGAHRPDVTALVLLGEVAVLLCLRELIDSLLQLRLTGGLREQALRDSLTGLPNLRALVQQVVALEGAADGWVVLTIDVDGFKQINDVLGHRAGDDLLIEVGRVLARERPPGTTAYRISGDEFAVLATGDLEEGRLLALSVRDRLRMVLAQAAPGMAPSASVGVGRLVGGPGGQDAGAGGPRSRRHPLDRPEFGTPARAAQLARAEATEGGRHELSALVESAAALRAAKAAGPGSVEVYSGQVAADRERRMLLEARLRTAVADGGIRTVAQPIVTLSTGKVSGFEALARWRDDELGEISPVEFIAIAEQTGLVVELGRQVLVGSIEQANRAGVFAAGCSLSINVSPIQLRVPGFVDLMNEELRRHDVRAEQVVVEVTEAIMVTEDDPALRTLAELNGLGVRVAIDDFGTGYSALGYLRRLPVQILKIDRSLTVNLMAEPRTLAIVEGVVRMAHQMGIRVTMEGIEDELEAQSCRGVEADQGQGWLFGRPAEWFQVADALHDPGDSAEHEAGDSPETQPRPESEPDPVPLLPVQRPPAQRPPAPRPPAPRPPARRPPTQRPQGEAPEVPLTEEPEVHAGH